MVPELLASRFLLAALLIIFTSAFLRLLYVLPLTQLGRAPKEPRTTTSHLLIVLGSGGHTAEMLSLIRSIDPRRYTPRTYVVSSGDEFGISKATQFEELLSSKTFGDKTSSVEELEASRDFEILTVPRARNIHQPLYTAPLSSLLCLWACVLLFLRRRVTFPLTKRTISTSPDLIITNGPATGVIVILASLVVKFLGLHRGEMKSIYVESWARVKTLSLSGKILLWGGLTERFLVQWEGLKGGRAEWRGFLVE